MISIRIHGRAFAPGTRPRTTADEDASIRQEFELARTRGDQTESQLLELENEDVLEFETPEGALFLLRADEVPAWFDRQPPGRSARPGVIDIDARLPSDEPDGARGGGGAPLHVRFLRIFGKDAAAAGAVALATGLEDSAVADHEHGHGLLRWNGRQGAEGFAPAGDLTPGQRPWLLFLHGTASSTWGSFGALFSADQGRVWQRIVQAYDTRILCLEHRSLTESPIRNALALMQALPAGIELHLVSHSRGGLIGELIARGQLQDDDGDPRDAFLQNEIALFADPAHTDHRADLQALAAEIAARQIRVTRFVRVACPAAGTGLMTGRLDRWVNLLLNAMLAAGSTVLGPTGLKIATGLKKVLRALVRERTNPQSLPGLAAMSPDESHLLELLNRPGVKLADSDLTVVAGDIEGGPVWQRMVTWITDRYFREDHDLVIETASMDRGTPRQRPRQVHFEQGPKVNHFSYFGNPGSARVIALALTDPSALADSLIPLPPRRGRIDPRAGDDDEPLVSRRRGGQQDVPVLLLLPGINGSHLADSRGRIWMHPLELMVGSIRRLAIDAPGVRPDGMLNSHYRDLFRHLDRNHQVIAWPYDWRRSLLDTADLFATELASRLDQTARPVRIVAHSMGGLVARAAFQRHPQLYARFRSRPGARLVMLGTPNGGSFAIPMMLLGRDRLMRVLAGLDLRHRASDQLAIVSRWPGVAQMLPAARDAERKATSGLDLFTVAGWAKLRSFDPDGHWTAPDATVLEQARAFRQVIDAAPADGDVMAFVAGRNTTPAAVFAPAPDQATGIVFGVAEQGDGRVLWQSGALPGVPLWYTDAAHGDLARHRPAFPGIVDLLESGETNWLDKTPPEPRRRSHDQGVIAAEPIGLLPRPEDLPDIAMAARPEPAIRPGPRVRVRVTNGHLRFAHHPLVLGHYQGDGLSGSERVLDQEQKGRLGRRMDRGLHPGAIGTHDVHLNLSERPSGSLIVGLGGVSELTSGRLHGALVRGLMELAAAKDERDKRSDWHRRQRGVSFVLIGTGAGVLSLGDSLLAILRAVRDANAELGNDGFLDVEIVENIEQRAIGAWQVLSQRINNGAFGAGFILDEQVVRGRGAWNRLAFDDDHGWWTPITIRQEKTGGGGLHFVSIAGRARAEAHLVATRRDFIDRYIDDLTGSRNPDTTLASARTLFELLWPNPLKQHSLDDRNIRLILDASAAALPWEMLDDRRPWQRNGTAAMNAQREPPAVRYGVLRQLVTPPDPVAPFPETARRHALVIGDPRGDPSDFAPLPGAEHEARQVARLLSERGFHVTSLIGDGVRPEDVVSALFSQAWQVVHIAAHGVFEHRFGTGPDARVETGIVLGGKDRPRVLDNAILRQMPVIPELFFVNCCHLGTITGRAARAERPELAASFAVQLIGMGVRAVVVAGWEVSDRPAQVFAERFYDKMLNGEGYGAAVRDARERIYLQDPSDTTWGAYQAYGHNDFHLNRQDDTDDDKRKDPDYAAPSEMVSELDRICAVLDAGGDQVQSDFTDHLTKLLCIARKRGWMENGALRAAFGRTLAELGDFAQAIDHYTAAIGFEDGDARIRAVEQLCNLEVRQAVLSKPGGAEKPGDATRQIAKAIARLDNLNEVCGQTPERMCLVGGAWKRLAMLRRTSAARRTALEKMSAGYCKALGLGPGRAGRFYPAAQRLLADMLLAITETGKVDAGLKKRLHELGRQAPQIDGPRDLDGRLCQADLLLLDALARGKLTDAARIEILDHHGAVWSDAGSNRAHSSAMEQFAFVVAVLSGATRSPDDLATALGELAEWIGAICPRPGNRP